MKEYRTKGLLHTPIESNGNFTLYELSDKAMIKGYTLLYGREFIKSFYSKEVGVEATLSASRSPQSSGLIEYNKHKV